MTLMSAMGNVLPLFPKIEGMLLALLRPMTAAKVER